MGFKKLLPSDKERRAALAKLERERATWTHVTITGPDAGKIVTLPGSGGVTTTIPTTGGPVMGGAPNPPTVPAVLRRE